MVKIMSFKGIMGHWSKYGGRRYDLVSDRQDSEIPDTWMCQSCAEPQPSELTPFKFEYPEEEYLRVCAFCFAEGCISLMMRIAAS